MFYFAHGFRVQYQCLFYFLWRETTVPRQPLDFDSFGFANMPDYSARFRHHCHCLYLWVCFLASRGARTLSSKAHSNACFNFLGHSSAYLTMLQGLTREIHVGQQSMQYYNSTRYVHQIIGFSSLIHVYLNGD